MTDVAIISRIWLDTRSLGFLTLPQIDHAYTVYGRVRILVLELELAGGRVLSTSDWQF